MDLRPGRSERSSEAYALQYVEDLSDARTQRPGEVRKRIFSIL